MFDSVNSLLEPINCRLLSSDILGGSCFIAPNASDNRFKPVNSVLNVAKLVPHFRLQSFDLVPKSPKLLQD
ncbi:MAG: hypothetical protein ACT4QB_02175 [Gammaproteobacteria bacterium]